MGVFAVLLFNVFALFHLIVSPKKRKLDRSRWLSFLLITAIPVFYLTELLSTDNVEYVWDVVQRKMALIFIPSGFFFTYLSGFNLRRQLLSRVFVGSVLFQILRVVVLTSIFGFKAFFDGNGDFTFLFRTVVDKITELHPTYFGIYIAMGLILILSELIPRKGRRDAWFWSGLLVFIIFFIFLNVLAARMALITALVSIVLVLFKTLRSRRLKWGMIAGIVSVSALAVLFIPSVNQRISEMFSDQGNSTNMRYEIYHCATNVVKEHGWTGTSVERLQQTLNDCYHSTGTILKDTNIDYNTHNEYLNIWGGKGIVGFVLFLLLLLHLFYKSWKHPIFLGSVVIIALICLTENILERQIGVFFFATWIAFFAIHGQFEEDTSDRIRE